MLGARTLLLILLVLFPQTGLCANLETALISLAGQKAWQSPHWRRLLHFPGQEGGTSRIDSRDFFLAPTGHLNPEAEGRATLAALFAAPHGSIPTACRYPARFRYLAELLAQEDIFLPVPECPDLDQWMANLAPNGVTLVFSESYLNNPPSMFGHTLLRIESSRHRSPLLAPTIGFAAETREERGIGYAFKGLFGGYQGRFSMGWYGDMVRRYGAVENRDIWEYRLDFTPGEAEFLLYHFWELRQAEFVYYFLDENCSFLLLSLLEAVRSELPLSACFPLWVVPTDTLREVVQQGLVRSVAFRPSRLSMLNSREAALPADLVALVDGLCRHGEAPLSLPNGIDPAHKAAVLESAADCLLYRQVSELGEEDPADPELAQLLDERNQLANPSVKPEVEPPAFRPDQGHGSQRLQLQTGLDEGSLFVGIGYRPVLHDLGDPAAGYDRSGQVQLLQPWFRFYPAKQQLRLEAFDILDILSVPSRTALVRPVAWQARLGMARMDFPDAGQRLTFQAESGLGVAGLSRVSLQSYLLANARLVASDRINGGVDIGPGFMSGVDWQGSGGWIVSFQAELHQYLIDQRQISYALRLRIGREISRGGSLFVEARQGKDFGEVRDAVLAGWSWYF